MARGPLSPVSQLGEERFSYCFASDDTTTALLVGSSANPSPQAASTPFVSSHSPLYYLSLQGISVGATLLPIPTTTLVLKPNGTGGLMGLPEVAVSAYDLCVSLAPIKEGWQCRAWLSILMAADTDFAAENCLLVDRSDGWMCLAILRPPFNFSISGNFQPQNMHVVYDLAGGKLSFEPANRSDRSLKSNGFY